MRAFILFIQAKVCAVLSQLSVLLKRLAAETNIREPEGTTQTLAFVLYVPLIASAGTLDRRGLDRLVADHGVGPGAP